MGIWLSTAKSNQVPVLHFGKRIKKLLIDSIAVIVCVALCTAVWIRNTEVKDINRRAYKNRRKWRDLGEPGRNGIIFSPQIE